MILSPEFERDFTALRKRLNTCINWLQEQGEPGKSYEGTWEIRIEMPDATDDPNAELPPDWCKIKLHCYLIGPSRHYEWTERTVEKAFERCKKDVEKWIEAEYENYTCSSDGGFE